MKKVNILPPLCRARSMSRFTTRSKENQFLRRSRSPEYYILKIDQSTIDLEKQEKINGRSDFAQFYKDSNGNRELIVKKFQNSPMILDDKKYQKLLRSLRLQSNSISRVPSSSIMSFKPTKSMKDHSKSIDKSKDLIELKRILTS